MKLKKDYIFYGILGNLIQYGLPISYITWRYEIFKFEEVSVTGWGAIGVMIGIFFLKDKIKNLIQSYNDDLGNVAKKGKWGIVFGVVAGILYASQFFIEGMLWLFIVLGGSNLLSLIPYSAFYNKKDMYLAVKEEKKKETIANKAKGVVV